MNNPLHSAFDEIPALKAQIRARDEEIERLRAELMKAHQNLPMPAFIVTVKDTEEIAIEIGSTGINCGDGVVGDDLPEFIGDNEQLANALNHIASQKSNGKTTRLVAKCAAERIKVRGDSNCACGDGVVGDD